MRRGMLVKNIVISLQAQQAIQKVFTDEVDGVEGAFYKITDVNETEPIFGELKSSELGFGSMDAAEHRHWPIGRGLYVNGGRNLSILINENDHLRFVSSLKGGDFGKFLLQNFINVK